jgi:hypothetical protein
LEVCGDEILGIQGHSPGQRQFDPLAGLGGFGSLEKKAAVMG